MTACPERPIRNGSRSLSHTHLYLKIGHARKQPLFSLEILFRHGSNAGPRAPDFSVPVRQRVWRTSVAGVVVYRGIFRNDSLSIDRSFRWLLRAAV